MDKLIITITGISLITIIYWFFFGKKEAGMEATNGMTILVEGGYKPALIKVKQGQSVTINFLRKDPSSCLEELVFPDYKIKEYLPLNQPVTITLPPPHPAKSGFHCGMNMFHGRIEVVA